MDRLGRRSASRRVAASPILGRCGFGAAAANLFGGYCELGMGYAGGDLPVQHLAVALPSRRVAAYLAVVGPGQDAAAIFLRDVLAVLYPDITSQGRKATQ